MEHLLFWFNKPWIIIFIIKIFEVSFETMRIALVANGSMVTSSIAEGTARLFQVIGLIYVFKNLNQWKTYIAYSCGHMTGNFLGLVILKGIQNMNW